MSLHARPATTAPTPPPTTLPVATEAGQATAPRVDPGPGPTINPRAAGSLLARGRNTMRPGGVRLAGDNLPGVIRLAAQLHELGHLREAARLYDRVLDTDPDHPDVLHLLGMLRAQQGRHIAAAGLLERAVRRRPNADVLEALGEVCYELGRWAQATQCFSRALELDPDAVEPMRNLGHSWFAQDRFLEAAAAYRQILGRHPDDANAWSALGFTLIHLDLMEPAERSFELAVRHDPSDVESRHLLDALRGRTTERAPDSYVRGLFDRYAGRYELHLQSRLQYRVPDQLRTLVDRGSRTPASGERILDLGCGTGLAGIAFAGRASRLVGVDLSPRMLDVCRDKDCYDELVESSIVPWLADTAERFDLVLAADVLNYCGDLEEILAGIRRVLRPGGLAAFSNEEAAGGDYALKSSGRYGHAPEYIDRLAATCGLETVDRREAVIRVERERPLTGHLTLLRRPV